MLAIGAVRTEAFIQKISMGRTINNVAPSWLRDQNPMKAFMRAWALSVGAVEQMMLS